MLINFRLCETESESVTVSETETMRLESGSAMTATEMVRKLNSVQLQATCNDVCIILYNVNILTTMSVCEYVYVTLSVFVLLQS